MEELKEVYIGAYVPRRLKDWLHRRAAAEHRTLSEELTLMLEMSRQSDPHVESALEGTVQTNLETSTDSLTVPAEQETTTQLLPKNGDAWTILESMEGSVEGPSDLASELDHYLYGTPKRPESRE